MTSLYQKYLNVFSFERRKVTDQDDQNRIAALSIFLIFGFVMAIIYSLYYAINDPSDISLYASLFVVLICFGSYIALVISLKHKILSYVLSVAIGILLLCFFFLGSYTDIMWLYVYPALTLFLLGLNGGMIFSAILFSAITFLIFTPQSTPVLLGHTLEFKMKFLTAYLVVFLISFIYEYIRKNTRQKLINSLKKLEISNETNKAKADFLVQLSHQIRTPLSSILGITNILKNDDLSKEQNELIDAINTSANNLVHVVNNIVNISEIKAEKEIQDILTINLNSIIGDSIEDLKKRNKKIDFNSSINVSSYVPAKLIGNPDRLKLLLHNVYKNIVSHSKKYTIGIDVFVNNKKESDDAVELLVEVHSNSVKLSRDLPENFDRIYDFSTGQDQAELDVKRKLINQKDEFDTFEFSEAKKIIEGYGGSLGIKISGGISIFWFTIVLWKQEANQARYEKIKKVDSGIEERVSGEKRLKESTVLVVEDNLMNQKVICLALKDKVANIEIANNGKEAINIFVNSKIDIILMDIQMPVLDGYKTASKIKELEIGTDIHTPIIALTANAMHGDKEKCLSLGMDDYISKPFQIDKLIAKMESLLQA